MSKERLSRLQKEILRALLEISQQRKEGNVGGNQINSDYPAVNIALHLTSKVIDKYYAKLLNTLGNSARYLKNVILTRKASVAISRSLVNLDKKGYVKLFEISQEVSLTEKGAEIAKEYLKTA